jgi:hypothetical protein
MPTLGVKALAAVPLKSSKRDPGLEVCARVFLGVVIDASAVSYSREALALYLLLNLHSPPSTTHIKPIDHKNAKTKKGVPVVIGGVTIAPGDWVYADPDGVLVAREKLALP